jgi:dTDP-4-amino-4,6-dideoxygalactose transaminase
VADAAAALVLLLEAPAQEVADEIFNIGMTEMNYQVLDLAERVAAALGGIEVEIVPSDEETRTYRVDCTKFCARFGWTPTRSIEDGIAEIKAAFQPGTEPFTEPYMNVIRLRRLLATPVDEGGEPVAPRFIPLARPMMDEDEERVIIETMRSGWLGAGPYVGQFEGALAEVLEAKHVVGIQNCTSAIHLCLAHLGIQPGDEVILSPITWASVGNLIVNMGATPVFADIDPATINVDAASVAERITPKTRAIVPVHHAGWSCDMDALRAVAEKAGVPIVEDAAHALGARYKGRPVGSDSRFACFSFHAIKNITTMEGGAIAVASGEEAERLRMLARNGMRENSWERYGRSSVAAPPEVVAPGFKYAMGNVAAAIGLVQLKKLPRFFAKRRWLAQLYRRELARFDEIVLPRCDVHEDHAWHLLVIRLKLDRLNVDRTEFAHLLRRENVGTGFHFWGLHLHAYYRERYGIDPASLPHATAISHDILSLPLFPGMTDKNVADIIRAIEKVLTHTRKRA